MSERGPDVGDKVATEVYGRVTAVRPNGDIELVLDAPTPLVRDPGQVVILSRYGE